MATDFFERQYQARRSTTWLVAMFLLAVVAVVGSTMAVGWFVANDFDPDRALRFSQLAAAPIDSRLYRVPGAAGLGALTLIGLGSLYKTAQLSGGGHVVAESLRGRRVSPDSTDPTERRLLNVVEEMAIASGVPAPPVFLLDDEQGLNAFAAGYSPSDAVVAVTRGAAEQLTRDELQGVVAHEFSHILNGDMRLNIRLIGVLHGILLLALIGRIMLRLASESSRSIRRSRDGKSQGGIAGLFVGLGLALVVIGYLGSLFGSLIKAAVSRQREYLADASAVQFTRNPDGLAGALKRIGGAMGGSKMLAANAAEASHLFFAQGVWEGFTGLTATHPPLRKRILVLDPRWDGTFLTPLTAPAAQLEQQEQIAGLAPTGPRVPLAVVARAADQVGDPHQRHRQYAAELIESLPAVVRDAVREPYSVRAVVFALLLDLRDEIRQSQLAQLDRLTTADVAELTRKLLPTVRQLEPRMRLPVVDLSLPALRALAPPQYREFIAAFRALVEADQRLGLFEWTLSQVLQRHLRPQFEKTAAKRSGTTELGGLAREASMLLSTLAHADNRREEAPAALARGAKALASVPVRLLTPQQCSLGELQQALELLAQVKPNQRRQLVEACATLICADREVTLAEAELLRGICDMLDCPMPPLLPGGPAESGGPADSAVDEAA